MAWLYVPWTGGDFQVQPAAFWNQFITALEYRVNAARVVSAQATATLDRLAVGTVIQSAALINGLRGLSGTYGAQTWTLFPNEVNSIRPVWVDGRGLANGEAWTEDEYSVPAGRALTSGTDPSEDLVTRVNEILTDAALPTMGTSLVDGGLPWTRKHGDKTALETDYGPAQAGDVLGPWIFNEWWAFLKALDSIYIPEAESFSWNTPAERTGYATSAATCADAKTVASGSWPGGSAGLASVPGGAVFRVSRNTSTDWGAAGRRTTAKWTWQLPTFTYGVTKAFVVASEHDDAPGSFSDFSDGFPQGEIAALTELEHDGSTGVLEPSQPTTEHFSAVTCPTVDGTSSSLGYKLTPHQVAVFDFPDP